MVVLHVLLCVLLPFGVNHDSKSCGSGSSKLSREMLSMTVVMVVVVMFACIVFLADASHIQLQKQMANITYKTLNTNSQCLPMSTSIKHATQNVE